MRALRPVRAAVFALAAFAGASAPAAGCFPTNELLLCGEIPAGGCPLGRGGSCDDSVCAGLYDCVEGKWTLAVDCAADGGTSTATGTASGGGSGGGDAGPDVACVPATISHAGEKQGCTPDLQNPDCPVAAAEAACLESVCLTGCVDFYLCTKDSWTLAAYCDEISGDLVILP